ncbi:MAG: DeoR family transcriptional regulator, partial [Terriglobia bacterium]
MRAAERQIKIQNLLRTQEFIDADELAAKFRASPSSLRRDLMELEQQGLARRVRGGAVSLQVRDEPRSLGWA